MGVFVIFRASNPASIEAALKNIFPANHYKVADGQWLVSGAGTAKDISDKLGISDGQNGSAMVFSMGSYFGRAPTEVWDWIKAKAEAPSG